MGRSAKFKTRPSHVLAVIAVSTLSPFAAPSFAQEGSETRIQANTTGSYTKKTHTGNIIRATAWGAVTVTWPPAGFMYLAVVATSCVKDAGGLCFKRGEKLKTAPLSLEFITHGTKPTLKVTAPRNSVPKACSNTKTFDLSYDAENKSYSIAEKNNPSIPLLSCSDDPAHCTPAKSVEKKFQRTIYFDCKGNKIFSMDYSMHNLVVTNLSRPAAQPTEISVTDDSIKTLDTPPTHEATSPVEKSNSTTAQ